MKSKFKKLLATALVLCLVLALLPAAAFADYNGLGIDVAFYDLSGVPDDYGSKGSVVITKGTGDKEYVITATPSEGFGLTDLKVKIGDSTEYAVIISETSGDQDYTEATFEAETGASLSVYAQFLPVYSIKVDLGMQNGSVQPQVTKAFADEIVNLKVYAKEGYSVDSVSVRTATGGTPVEVTGSGNSWSFEMPASEVVVGATFVQTPAPTPYNITVQTNINGGKINYSSSSALAGSTVNFTVTPYTDFAINEVCYVCATTNQKKVLTGNNGSYSFEMPSDNIRLEASFNYTGHGTKYYPVTTSSNFGGTISDSGWATYGSDYTVKIEPYNGYSLKSIKVNGWDYTGTVEWTTNWWGYKYGTLTFTVYGDTDVVVEFKEDAQPGTDYHYINVTNPGWHCSVNVPSGAYCGNDVTINLSNFDAGYAFSYLKVNGEYVTPYGFNGYLSYTFKMPHKDVAIEVGTTSVSGKYYIDTSYDSTLGGVEVWVNNNYVNNWHQGSWADYNDTVSFKVKPYYSDDVVSVSVVGKRTGWNYSCDYNSYSGWYTFTMPNEDVTINVDFRSGVHKVYVDKVTDGKLTVSDDWAKYGQIVYITAVPDYGCTLSSLSVRTATGDSVHVYNAQKADTYYFYMPDQYVSVSAVFTGKYTSLPFNDVSYGDWYYDAVQFVYSKGIMDGVDYYKFAPNGTITRGMIVTMLWRMAGEPFEMPVTSFTDVEIGRYYTTAVAWACRNGIADGMGESTFGPNDAITREELVTLLYRYAQYFGHSCIGTSIEGFADAGSVSSYAYNAMCWAYKAGVVTGTTGSRLNPQGTASRAEAAQMIMSFYSFLNS